MPLPVIANVGRLALACVKGSGGGEPSRTINVMHVRKSSGDAWSSIANAIATHLDTTVHGAILNMLNAVQSSYGYQSFDLTPLDGTSNTLFREGATSNWPVGAGGGDYVPQVAAVLRIRTATRGRSARGRLFLGPVAESKTSNGQIAGGVPGLMSDSWDAFVNALATDGVCEVGVASYLKRVFYPATDVGVVPHTATQRRRNKHT